MGGWAEAPGEVEEWVREAWRRSGMPGSPEVRLTRTGIAYYRRLGDRHLIGLSRWVLGLPEELREAIVFHEIGHAETWERRRLLIPVALAYAALAAALCLAGVIWPLSLSAAAITFSLTYWALMEVPADLYAAGHVGLGRVLEARRRCSKPLYAIYAPIVLAAAAAKGVRR